MWENGTSTINHSYIPPGRTTHDGRIQLESFSLGGFMPRCFRLIKPELANANISTTLQALSGALGDRKCIDVQQLHASAHLQSEGIQGAICDPGPSQAAGPVTTFDTNKQPTPCTDNPANDCYQITTITHIAKLGAPPEVWSKKLRIEVANPKTASATISKVVADPEPPRGKTFYGLPEILEPVISGDGRVLVWHTVLDIMYAHNPPGSGYAACDARGFGTPKSVALMHGDPAMSAYGLAKFPLRDSQNRPVQITQNVGGAYPWIDRDVSNLFIVTAGSPLYYRVGKTLVPRFPVLGVPSPANPPSLSPEPPTEDTHIETVSGSANNGGRTGVMVMGLWTQGKMVVLDNRINNSDIAVLENCVSFADHSTSCAQPPIHDRYISLYHDASGTPIPTQIGASNVFFINSPENVLNYDAEMRPVSPRDVVWQVAATTGTDEVAFDDFMATRALIVSPMNAPVDNTNPDLHRRNYVDGFEYLPDYGGAGWTQTPHVQNAAGSRFWTLPGYGELLGGARIEPIAAGGVKGKGIWLDGNDTISYTVPAQTAARANDMAASAWMYSLWFNPTSTLTATAARLLRTPDGTNVSLSRNATTGEGTVTLQKGAAAAVTFTLPAALTPATTRFTNLALVVTPAGSSSTIVQLYIDGFLRETRTVAQSLLRTSAGQIVVGGGAIGWVDELKVIARVPNPEEMCNHVHGTLVGVTSGPGFTAAGNYPASSHTAITSAIGAGTSYGRYYCESQVFAGANGGGNFICRTSRTDPRCVGRRAIFPEGPLMHGVPRPVSTANTFCTSCHDASNPTPSMKPVALERFTTPHEDDARRQPMQPEPRLWGVIPAHFFAPGVPLSTITSNPSGFEIDPVTLPAGTLCTPGPTTLCLMNRRFSVSLIFTHPQTGVLTPGNPVPHTANTGHFWFFNAANLEVTVKALDGFGFNQKAWVFQSGITDVPYKVTVLDHFNGTSKEYAGTPPAADGTVCGTQDIAAFLNNVAMGTLEPVTPTAPLGPPPAGGNCVPGVNRLCALGRRYEVTARYRDSSNNWQAAKVRGEQTNETGFFTFFDDNNLELIVKVLDGTEINQKIWLFYGSLTDVVFELTLRDTLVPRQATFASTLGPQGQQCGKLSTAAL